MFEGIKYQYYRAFPGTVPDLLEQNLMRLNPYFVLLAEDAKKEFLKRTYNLMRSLKFSGLQEIVPSTEMKTLISSALAQITFGYDSYFFSSFSEIVIAPRSYTFKRAPVAFLGHTDPYTESITMSWPHVKLGYGVEEDSKNLALHELAHGLFIQQHQSSDGKYFNRRTFTSIKTDAPVYMKLIEARKIDFIRPYGASNFMEFFSCSVEAFFENSVVFKRERPVFYNQLCDILNQDPNNGTDPRKRS